MNRKERQKDSLKLYCITILFLRIRISYPGASITIRDDVPKSTMSKEMIAITRSKMLLKYTHHLYDKQGHLSQALLHKNEPLEMVLHLFSMSIKTSKL